MTLSLVLLICDRESEEIFYKEREADEEEGEVKVPTIGDWVWDW